MTLQRRRKTFRERIQVTNGRPEWKDQPAKKVFVNQLITHLNKCDLAWPKTETLAKECGISRGYLGTLSKELEAEGRLIRRKFIKGELLPNPDPAKQYPASPGQYLYYATPKMFDEAPNPDGVPLAIFKPFYGGNACSLSKHHSSIKTCSPSVTTIVDSVTRSCSLSQRPLQEQIKNKQKEQFDAGSAELTEIKSKVDNMAKMFTRNDPFDPSVFQKVINDAIANGIELPKDLSMRTQQLENRKLISRNDNEMILSIHWKAMTSVKDLVDNHEPITGKEKNYLDQIIHGVASNKKLCE